MHTSTQNTASSLAVMKFSALGDIAIQLPFLRAISQPLCIITSPIGKAFLEDEFSDFIVLRNKSAGSLIRIIHEIRKRRFSDLIDLQGNDRSRLITFISGSKVHNGYDPYRKPPYSELAREIWAKVKAEEVFAGKPRSYVVFNPGSSAKWSAKRPPVWKWVEFAKIINTRYSLPIKLTGSAEELDYVNTIADALPGEVEVMAGKTSLPELKRLLADAFLTVSTDSAALHISAVQGTPTIGLFGSTTWQDKLRHPWTIALYDKIYYPTGEMPVCTAEVDNYYDHIDIEEGLTSLEQYLI